MPSFYIVLAKEIPGVDVYVNGNSLSKNNDELDRIAKSLKVRPLMSFFSTSQEEASSFAEGHGVELKAVPEEKWFAPDVGLTTVNALLASLSESELARPDQIEAELREFVRLLETAKANGVRWHLAIDY
jgi:hypothetical protein